MDDFTKKVPSNLLINIEEIVNEPSLALYRIQEHINKSVITINNQHLKNDELHHIFDNVIYDVNETKKCLVVLNENNSRFEKLLQKFDKKAISSESKIPH